MDVPSMLNVTVPANAVGDGRALARLAVNALRADRDGERARLRDATAREDGE